MKNFKTFIFLSLYCSLLATSCVAQKTYSDLKTMVKIFATQKMDTRQQLAFSMNLFNDQRLEYQGYGSTFFTGAHSTYLNEKDYKALLKSLKKINLDRFSYINPSELEYSVQYVPLIKSMGAVKQGKILSQTPETIQLELLLNRFLKEYKWIKQDLAPSPFGENVPNEVIVTMEKKTNIKTWIKKYDIYKLKTINQLDTFTNTWSMRFDTTKVDMKNMVNRLDEDNLNVVGVLPNRYLASAKNMAYYNAQEVLIELQNTVVSPDALVADFGKYDLKLVERIAPNLNYYKLSFDAAKIEASTLLEKLRAHPSVKAAQINKDVNARN